MEIKNSNLALDLESGKSLTLAPVLVSTGRRLT